MVMIMVVGWPALSTMLLKAVEIVLAGAALGTGLRAAWLWLKASKVEPDPGRPANSVPPSFEVGQSDMLWASIAAAKKSADLNAKAAKWTAAAVALGTVGSVVGIIFS